jgi:glycosyltransferase involved in cell wall biosynthesis
MEDKFFLSICIPSYNRPKTIIRLLESIDVSNPDEIEVVICEDKSPMRKEIREGISFFKASVPYEINYFENPENYGFDKNWRELSLRAKGHYLLYMGDDDAFIPGQLDVYIEWLRNHPEPYYILRSYVRRYGPGDTDVEYFRYFDDDVFFDPGVDGYKAFFMKSISMSGFTVKRSCSLEFLTSDVDNTLLYQLYLLAEVCLKYPSAYCNTPCAMLISDQAQLFGNSRVEKGMYTPGQGVGTNLNFIKSYFRIADYLDEKHGLSIANDIKNEYSKYSFYTIAGKRELGIKAFNKHVKQLRSIGLDSSAFFNIYYFGLLVLGKKPCLWLIRTIKRIKGRSLHL